MTRMRRSTSPRPHSKNSQNPPSRYHVDEDCHQVDAMDRVREMSLSEAEEKCSRQANCCSTIVALEDLD